MSVELRDVKRRINSTRHIGKVTSALQQVSSAKLARARRNVKSSSLYTEQAIALLQGIVGSGSTLEHPLLRNPSSAPICVLVIGSDRGLCGGYNSAVMDLLTSLARAEGKENLALIVVGDIPRKRAAALGLRIDQSHRLPSLENRPELIDSIAGQMSAGFINGSYGRAMMIYTHFISPIDKDALIKNILPLSAIDILEGLGTAPPDPRVYSTAIYDPSAPELVERLVPEVLRQAIDYAYLHSVCSEDAYRQEAMMRASDNAQEMLRELKLSYSRLRQQDITTEMLEIAASGGMSAGN